MSVLTTRLFSERLLSWQSQPSQFKIQKRIGNVLNLQVLWLTILKNGEYTRFYSIDETTFGFRYWDWELVGETSHAFRSVSGFFFLLPFRFDGVESCALSHSFALD